MLGCAEVNTATRRIIREYEYEGTVSTRQNNEVLVESGTLSTDS